MHEGVALPTEFGEPGLCNRSLRYDNEDE